MRATVHTCWDLLHSTLKVAFHALIHSKLDYAAAALQPWLSTTNLPCLDCLQNRSFWLITGKLVSTSLEALSFESDVQIYHTWSNWLSLKAQEKSLRSTDDYPKRVALAADIPQCFQNCCSFCRKANDPSTLLSDELEHWKTIKHFPSPPWQPLQGTYFYHCFWYFWSGWWHWSEMSMQYHTHCTIPGWLHHLHQRIP